MKPAIRVQNLAKLYQLGDHQHGAYKTLREALTAAVAAPWRRLRARNGANGHPAATPEQGKTPAALQSIWALKDVSFEVQPGEVVASSAATAPANRRC